MAINWIISRIRKSKSIPNPIKYQLHNNIVQKISLSQRKSQDRGKTKTYQPNPENKNKKEEILIKKKLRKS